MTTLSLVSFCPHCFASGQPKFGTPFVVFGSHSKKFHIYQVEHRGQVGFVPCIVELVKVVGQNVIYNQTCSICGVKIWEDGGDGELRFMITKRERKVLTLEIWNQWILYHSDPDYWL